MVTYVIGFLLGWAVGILVSEMLIRREFKKTIVLLAFVDGILVIIAACAWRLGGRLT